MECAICLEKQELPCKQLKCKHIFHEACIAKWEKQTCPICRDYYGTTPSYEFILIGSMNVAYSARDAANIARWNVRSMRETNTLHPAIIARWNMPETNTTHLRMENNASINREELLEFFSTGYWVSGTMENVD
jgi:hypothetical protein